MVRFSILLIYLLVWEVASATVAHARDAGTPLMREADKHAVEQCRSAAEGAVILNPSLACLRGLITDEVVEPLYAYLTPGEQRLPDENQRKRLVINSPGGSVTTSLELGRRLHKSNLRLIVDQKCFSSCANYIVPAAFILIVSEKSLIALHGSVPRQPSDYDIMVLNSRVIKPQQVTIEIIEEVMRGFPAHHDQFIAPETQYFSDIHENEYYLHRYFEVKRNIKLHAKETCQIKNGFNLIVGPKYVEEFLLTRPGYFWWPENTQEIFDFLASYGMNYTFVLDLDMFPSWTPAVGFVDQSTCMAARSPRAYRAGENGGDGEADASPAG